MRQLAAQHGIPCIAVTGHAEEEYARRVATAGICLHLCKPIEFKKLLDAIERCRPKADEAA
jgi:FixJ family two-component response regulator